MYKKPTCTCTHTDRCLHYSSHHPSVGVVNEVCSQSLIDLLWFLRVVSVPHYYISCKPCVAVSQIPKTTCSGMLSIVGKREMHAKLEARSALRYVQCGLHIHIYIYIYIERERERERERKSPVHITRRTRYVRQLLI